jgi:hypothetical protein
MSFHSEIPMIKKYSHLNFLNLLAVKYQQAAIEADIKNDKEKAQIMATYCDKINDAATYIIALYDSEERSSRMNSDLLRTIATQELEIQELRKRVVALEKTINETNY